MTGCWLVLLSGDIFVWRGRAKVGGTLTLVIYNMLMTMNIPFSHTLTVLLPEPFLFIWRSSGL